MERNPWVRALVVLLIIIAVLHLGDLLWQLGMRFADIIMLFFLAWLLAFALHPPAMALARLVGLPWAWAVAVVYLLLFLSATLAAVLAVPLLAAQLTQLATALSQWAEEWPVWAQNLQQELARRRIEVDLVGMTKSANFPRQMETLASTIVQGSLNLLASIVYLLLSTVLILVLSFYFALEGDRIAERWVRLMPPQHREEARFFLESVGRAFGGFIRGQLIQGVIYAVGTALVMWATGLGYILVASLLAGLAMLIPFVGPLVALVPPLVVVVLQDSPGRLLVVAGALLLLQQIVLNVIAPKVMGEAVGLHPLLVFLAMLVGGKVAGLAGVIFGVPVAGVLSALGLFFYQRTTLSGQEAMAPASAPPTTSPKLAEAGPGEIARQLFQRLRARFARRLGN